MWPDDGDPRFVLASVRGWPVSPSATTDGRSKATLMVQVLDRAYAHRCVREYDYRDARGPGSEARRVAMAETPAADLNAQDAA